MKRLVYYNDIKKSFTICKRITTCVVEKGDSVVDATAGNGHDTLFFADLSRRKWACICL